VYFVFFVVLNLAEPPLARRLGERERKRDAPFFHAQFCACALAM